MATETCSHCQLPLGRLAQRREVNGTEHWFCCYGCCLAYQFARGARDEPEAAALLVRVGVGGFLAMNIMLFSLLLYTGSFETGEDGFMQLVPWLLWALATLLVWALGTPFIVAAWHAAAEGRATADTLVTVGAGAAYLYSSWQTALGTSQVYFDTTTMVLVLFTLGRYLEALGRARAVRSLAPILAAERAEVVVVEDGVESLRPAGSVRPGDLVRVRPGERIGVDGCVLEGDSACDESFLTGQREVQQKSIGDRVQAGSLNGTGRLLVRATGNGGETRWVRIGKFIEAALARKSLVGETADRAAARFIPLVLALAGATLWFWGGREGFHQGLLAAMAVLVVACPCSLGLAVPLAISLGIAKAAAGGILIRGGGVLERLAQIKAVAFDKTGTLTLGRPQVASVAVDGVDAAEFLRHARALARCSDHPLALAVIERWRPPAGDPQALEVRAHPGAGLTGQVDGEPCALGSARLMRKLGWPIPEPLAATPGAEAVVYVGWGGRVHGRFAFTDIPSPEATTSITALHSHGISTLLLSGDREPPVAKLATVLGMSAWRSELSPEDKVACLQEWSAGHGAIAMVGDGLNDGPVLAAACVGVAVGDATDLAKSSADVTLPRTGVVALPWLLQLAAEVRSSIRINLAWAFGYNAVALGLAAAGLLRPELAAALMAGSSLLVAGRTLRVGGQAVRPRGAGLGTRSQPPKTTVLRGAAT